MSDLKTYFYIAITCFALTGVTACSDDGDDGNQDPDAAPVNEDLEYAENLWTEIGDYSTWDLFPGSINFNPSAAPHGDFARIFANQTAQDDTQNFADGSIIIKRNYQSDTADDDYDSVTLMQKRDGYSPDAGDWFWAKYNPDGSVQLNGEGAPLAGQIGLGGTMGCIPCHSGAEGDDYVFLNDGPGFGTPADRDMFTNLWTDNDISDYENWGLMPNTMDFEDSAAPHGDFARIFINGAMAADPTAPADGSVVVKRNYQSNTEGDYDALTIMIKVAGYSPDAADWFWAKTDAAGVVLENPDGVALVGRVGINGGACIGCHTDAPDGDYLFKN